MISETRFGVCLRLRGDCGGYSSFLVFGWLCIQPLIGFAKWLFHSSRSLEKNGYQPARTFPETDS
jgi:hypothetical protein